MWFGEILPERFFSLLASKNKEIYLSALLVIQEHYRQDLLLKKSEVISLLIDHLEEAIWQLESEDEEELSRSLSSRAYYLLRQLIGAGWLEREYHYQSLEEFLLLPEEAAVILTALQSIPEDNYYNSLVYSTYASLTIADQERDDYMLEALLQAHRTAKELQESLRRLFNNMRRHYQKLYQQKAVHNLIREHFENYQVLILDRIYHPLKTLDSIPRYKSRILKLLQDWLTDKEVLEHLAALTLHKGFSLPEQKEEALNLTVKRIGEIMEIYQGLELTLREIDRKNAAYTKALVERIRYLLNEDRGISGKLVEILKRAKGQENLLEEQVQLYRQGYLEEDSLAKARSARSVFNEAESQAVASQINPTELEQELSQFEQKIRQTLTRAEVIAFIMSRLQTQASFNSRELILATDSDFLKLILATVRSQDPDLPFEVEFLEGYLLSNGYRVPEMIFRIKGGERTGA